MTFYIIFREIRVHCYFDSGTPCPEMQWIVYVIIFHEYFYSTCYNLFKKNMKYIKLLDKVTKIFLFGCK